MVTQARAGTAPAAGRLAGVLAWAEIVVLALVAPLLLFPRPVTALAVLVLAAVWAARWRRLGALSVPTLYDRPLLALALLLPLALLPVVDWSLAAPKLGGLLLGVACVYALANTLSTPGRVEGAVRLTAAGLGAGLVGVGLLGTALPASKVVVLTAVQARLPRLLSGVVQGTERGSIHANEVAGALTLLLPLTAALLLTRGRPERPWRWLAWRAGLLALMTAELAVLGLTQSRSGLAGTAAGLFGVAVWWLVLERRGWLRRAAAIALGAVAVATAGFGGRAAITWSQSPDPGLSSFPSRIELWSTGLTMLRDFAVTGIGLGQFSVVLQTLYPPFFFGSEMYVPHAHNVFLQLGLDFGLPGAAAVLVLFAACFRGLARAVRAASTPGLRAAGVGLLCGIAGFLVFGLTDAIALGARGALPLWILLGLSAALARVATQPASDHL